jgi:hypothetical protein
MRRLAVVFPLLFGFVALLLSAQVASKTAKKKPRPAPAGGGFTLECAKLPFDAIATKPDPFAECGNCGVLSTNAQPAEVAAKPAQSHAKNNFCADTSKITPVTISDLRSFQAQAAQKGLVATDLPDRSKLTVTLNGASIAEGNVVRLVAWVQDAHLSDCAAGEEVNCKISGSAHSDIHIVLVDPAASGGRNQDECSSVTAEMSPHFRPAGWSQLNKKIPTSNVVRVTGPLFFDNAHVPCRGLIRVPTGPNKDEAPFRSSLWEIHPVYDFAVCSNTDPAKCNVADASVWKPYDQWVKVPTSQTAATKVSEGCVEPGTQAPGNVAAQCPSR